MTEESFTLTNYGLNRILRNGCSTVYTGLDGATTPEDRTATSPVQELTTLGAGRQLATNSDTSIGNSIKCRISSNYEFSGVQAINGVFISNSGSSGPNMMGRGKLAATRNVGPQDTMTIQLDLEINQVV